MVTIKGINIRTWVYTLAILIAGGQIHAQGIADALRFSTFQPGGTARTMGAGSAFGSLGGDFGAISINPASLGTYRASEIVFTPSLHNNNVSSSLFGTTGESEFSKSRLGIENIGVVFSYQPTSNWQTSNLAIGLNKVANFNSTFSYGGQTIGSITERWTELADGFDPQLLEEFEAFPAFVSGAIFDFQGDNIYETDFSDNPDQSVTKQQLVEQSGSINELVVAWGGNLSNKFNIGLSLGLPFVSFNEIATYEELDPNDEIDFFNSLEYTEFLSTSGTGFNLSAGFIYLPTPQVRMGLSIKSPTWFFLTDDFDTNIAYSFTENGTAQTLSEASPPGSFRYRFNAPWIVTGSLGSVYRIGGLQGFISGDVEYKDYTSNSFNLGAYSANPDDRVFGNELNRLIAQELQSTVSFRVGTELAYQKFRFRVGGQLAQSPFRASGSDTDNSFSGGFGFREDKFFLDFAYVSRSASTGYIPYDISDDSREQFVNNDSRIGQMVATVGFKF